MTAPAIDQPVEGRFDGSEHLLPIRVYFEDTDMSGVVYHANYLRFCERARSDMLRLAGIDQRAHFEQSGDAYAVADIAIRYAAPARLDDAVVVRTRVSRVTPARIVIQQRVMRGAVLLADAAVTAALVGRDGRPRRQPAGWLERYRTLVSHGEQTP